MRESTLWILYVFKFIELGVLLCAYAFLWISFIASVPLTVEFVAFLIAQCLIMLIVTFNMAWNPMLSNLRLKFVLSGTGNPACCYTGVNKVLCETKCREKCYEKGCCTGNDMLFSWVFGVLNIFCLAISGIFDARDDETYLALQLFLWTCRFYLFHNLIFMLIRYPLIALVKLLTVCCPQGREMTDEIREYDDRVISFNYWDTKVAEYQNVLNGVPTRAEIARYGARAMERQNAQDAFRAMQEQMASDNDVARLS